jgi:hypothetical protein
MAAGASGKLLQVPEGQAPAFSSLTLLHAQQL